MKSVIKFGEDVEGFNLPVLNEREIRAAAGIIFLLMFISVTIVITRGNFLLLKYSVTIFLNDILIRVIINPKFSPSLIIGRLIVGNQVPEYVGAEQKRFAWIIGALLSTAIFIHLVILNAYSPITGIICLICLLFLFFESAFGICLGCKFYSLFYRKKPRYCPGEVCEIKSRHEIQRPSIVQLLVIVGFVLYLLLTFHLLNDNYKIAPHKMFEGKAAILKNK